MSVRPYTLRKEDTLESIAKKRDISVKELLAMNPEVSKTTAVAGKTILLPAGMLSKRDKEILGGIGQTYRIYPVRGGETLKDIMSKRGISMEEMLALNPGLDLSKKLGDNQLLKLPGGKFTVREREMLMGILPKEFFSHASQAANNPFAIGAGILFMVCGFVLAWQRFYPDKDFNADE